MERKEKKELPMLYWLYIISISTINVETAKKCI